MRNNTNDYVNYFRQLAVSHYLILHDSSQEGPNATQKGKCRFVLFDNDEVVTGLRSVVPDGIVFYLEMFTGRGVDNLAGDYRGQYQGRFLIAKKVKAMSITELQQAYAECEGVMWDIIGRMLYDNAYAGPDCELPFRNLTLNDFTWEPVSNLWDGRAGWVVDFNYQQSREDEITNAVVNGELNPTVWTNE